MSTDLTKSFIYTLKVPHNSQSYTAVGPATYSQECPVVLSTGATLLYPPTLKLHLLQAF